MKTLFSTAGVRAGERFAYWHDVACKTIVGHESKPERRSAFEARITSADIAGMGVIVFENSPMAVNRTKRNIAQAPDECVFVCRQLSGWVGLEQLGRAVVLERGDVTIIDAQRHYQGTFGLGSRMLVLKAPRRAVSARLGDLSSIVARKTKPLGPVVSSHLAMLERGTGTMDQAMLTAVREYTLDLIALSYPAEARAGRSATRSLTRSRLRASIEARLSDPELKPASAAESAGMSVRYANLLLSEEGTSLLRLIHERRLDRCRDALTDPLQHQRTISDIAFGWGFADLTHFGRLFRKRFGMSARDYRAWNSATKI
jgi:AraC family transcriptional regulator, positive regulator of tynA and feaB